MGRRGAIVDVLVTPQVRYGCKPRCALIVPAHFRISVTTIPRIVRAYHRSYHMHSEMVETLRPHSASFETSRQVINRWVAQPHLEETSWDAEWEDLCQVEVDRWQV